VDPTRPKKKRSANKRKSTRTLKMPKERRRANERKSKIIPSMSICSVAQEMTLLCSERRPSQHQAYIETQARARARAQAQTQAHTKAQAQVQAQAQAPSQAQPQPQPQA
jgi:hypothetical protein